MDRHDALLSDWRQRALALETQATSVVIGQQRAIRLVVTAVFARGHVLLQGDVGVGKTTLLPDHDARGLRLQRERTLSPVCQQRVVSIHPVLLLTRPCGRTARCSAARARSVNQG